MIKKQAMKPVVLCSVLLVAAAGAAHARATKVQKEVVKEALEVYPSPFTVPETASPLAWDRASEWIAAIPDKRIEVDNKNALQNYRSYDSGNMDLSCSVKRRKVAGGASFTANCNINNMFAAGEARRGGVLLRRYIMTGEEACMISGERWLDAARCLLECSDDGNSCDLKPAEQWFPEVVAEEPMVVGDCTFEQITTMIASGLNQDQVKAACGD